MSSLPFQLRECQSNEEGQTSHSEIKAYNVELIGLRNKTLIHPLPFPPIWLIFHLKMVLMMDTLDPLLQMVQVGNTQGLL